MDEFLASRKWMTGCIHADELFRLAKSHYGEEHADDLREELMKFRLENKRDMLTGESLE